MLRATYKMIHALNDLMARYRSYGVRLFLGSLAIFASIDSYAVVPTDNSFDSPVSAPYEFTSPESIGGATFSLVAPAGQKSTITAPTGNVSITEEDVGKPYGYDLALIFNIDSSNTVVAGVFDARITSTDGSEFRIASMEIDTGAGLGTSPNLTVTGYRDGVSVASDSINTGSSDSSGSVTYTKNGVSLGYGGVLTFGTGWQYIDEIRFTGTNTIVAIDDIDFEPGVLPTPTITSAIYNASSGVLAVTGTNFSATGGATNDVIANKFTLTAEGGSTYTLTDTANVEIGSATSFSLTLSATDRAAVNQIVNKNGTSSTSGTTYNIAGAAGFIANAPSTFDFSGNGVTVSNVAVPTISSATYDASTGTFVVTGTNLLRKSGSSNDIDGTKFTFKGEGGSGAIYTFVDTSSVEITSDTSFTLLLGTADRNAVNLIADKNGTSSVSGTTYVLNGLEDWATGADSAVTTADAIGNSVTVSNVAVPTITSATYNVTTRVLLATGTGFLRKSGSTNDIVANKFTFTGQGGSTYTLTDTANIEVTSTTSFTLTLSSTDGAAVSLLLNNNGTSSMGGTTYNLAAAEDWAAGADSAVVVADLTGNGITVSNALSAPNAPTIGTATAGDGQASVTFSAPGSNGGSSITTYTATASPGGAFGTCAGPAACTATVTGLSNGTAYTFTVTATNAIGTSSGSGVSNSVTPKGTQTITFGNPGTQNFGTTPTLTATATSSLTPTFSSSTTGVCTITSGGALAFVTAGSCTIDADQAGNTAWNAASTVSQTFTVNAVSPGAPSVGTATAGDTQATVTFTAPASTGGAAIIASGYTVTVNPGGATATGSSSPITVTGLTNGVAYTFTITATNSVGTGSASAASNSITPKAAQTITFNNPGTQNFGTTPTLTATATSSLTVAFTSATTGVCTITSGGTLSFVAAGTCTINANQAGDASNLAASQVGQSFTVNAITPAAPTIGAATVGDTQASISFTAPASTGGTNITGYTVTSNPGGITGTGSSSPIIVTGLTNGIAYTFTVTATNSAGTGSASAASNSITPAANQTITFINPGAQNFGTTPTLSATADSGLTPSFTSSTTGVCTITTGGALAFVSVGTCTINAGQAGNSSYLIATPVSQSFTVNAVVPAAPTIGTATSGNTQATVTFTAPSVNGGANITGYTVTANPGGATGTGASSPITVTGLTNGIAYTFTVTATNSAGTGTASAASNSITPAANQTITFTDPGAQNFGVSPSLTASASSGLPVSFGSSTTAVCTVDTSGVVTLLSVGTCTLTVSQAGNGSYSAAAPVSHSFTVSAVVPAAPTIGIATAGNGQASVTFVAPGFDGGASVTGYTVTATPGGATASGVTSPITVMGLTNGTAYTFTITANNSVGTGAASAASNSVTPTSTQTITFADPGTQNLGTSPTLTATASSGLTVSFSSSTTSVCAITSGGVLTLLTSGTCTVDASQAGNSAYQAATTITHSFSVVAVAPGAPTIGVVTASNGQATVNFTAPSVSGSSTITGYTVTSSPGGITATGTTSPIIVSGLTDGVAYTFTVTATSSAGTGSASTASTSVTPKTSQTISFTDPGTQTMGSPGSLLTTASSGLSVSLSSSTSTVCIVSLGNLVLISSGTCTITAEQAGNTIYVAATSVSHSFTVNPAPNEAPVITQGSLVNVTMSEDGAPTAFVLQLDATDSNSDTLTWSIAAQPGNGSVSVGTTGGVSYIPTENFNGTDVFTVAVSDGEFSTNSQVTVTVTPVNDAPVISGIPTTSLNQDAPYSFVPVVSDVDANTTLTFSITNKPVWATFDAVTGALTGTPGKASANLVTLDVVISVTDGTNIVSLPSFSVHVLPISEANLTLWLPANLQLNATALYTPVTLRQLLKLPSNSTTAELDAVLDELATDSDGNSCCVVVAEGVSATQPVLLSPGHHEIKWTATNLNGEKVDGVQVVDIRPLVSLSKSQLALRGSNTEFRIILNGPSPTYPVTVAYTLDENTTATTAEHTLTSGTATLANSGQLEVAVPVTLKPGSGLGDSQIVVRLTGDSNIGATNRHTISIREGNVAPTVKLSLTQNSFSTTTITPNGGPVSVVAMVTDLNVGDAHSFDWSGTTGLTDTDGNLTDATRVFSPASLTGSHQVQVVVTDSAGAHVQTQLNFRVLESLPVLSADMDTDDDGITDDLEGTGDADSNGIPDYLDNMPSSNILPQQIATTNKYLIECDPGVRCSLGLLALASSTGGVQILDSEVGTLGDLKADTSFTPVGGIFDFAISDLPTAGQSINVAIPQVAPIPANAIYRKFQNGKWVSFVENVDNALHSALGNPGYCPPPGSADWQPGLIAGNYCVQLTISDGGPNDADGIVNSAVVDPGAVSVAVTVMPPVEPPVQPPVEPPVNPPTLPPVEIKTKGGGGAMDYTLLLLVGGFLLMHRRSKLFALGTLLLVSISSQAADFSNHLYLRLDAYKINGDKNEQDFNSQLASDGYSFALTKYDVDRTGGQVSIGYKWNENIYTELGYLDLGDVRVNLWLDADENQTAFGKSFARHYPRSADGITLVQGIRLPFNHHWSVSPELGVFVWKSEVEVNGGNFRVGDKRNEDLLVGVRLDYQVTDSFGVGLGVRSLLFSQDTVNLWGISTRWDF